MIAHYNKNFPLSILVYKDNGERRYGICYIFENEQYMAPIRRNNLTEVIVGESIKYCHWILDKSWENSQKLDTITAVDYGLLLPFGSDPHRPGWIPPPNYYTITTYLWNSEESVVY
jgi:hypothetical protein